MSQANQGKNRSSRRFEGAFAVLLLLGVVLRLARLIANRSFWADELAIALNLRTRGWGELLEPLDFHQVAPVGFLWVVKLCHEVLGDEEWVLRFFPWLVSVAGLVVFARVARNLLGNREALIAFAMFVVLEPLVYYSAELKPYVLDVGLGVLLVGLAWHPLGPRWKALAVAGAVGVWFSATLTFVAAAVGGVCFLRALVERDRSAAARWAGVSLLWLASFAIEYGLVLSQLQNDEYLMTFWGEAFPSQEKALDWWGRTVRGMFQDPGGFAFSSLPGLVFLVGVLRMFRRRPWLGAILVVPTCLGLLAATFHLYPFPTNIPDRWEPVFWGRLVLFLVPAWILIIAHGLGIFFSLRVRGAEWMAMAGFVALMAWPIGRAAHHLVHSPRFQEMRPLLNQIAAHEQSLQPIYVEEFGRVAYRYYAEGKPIDPEPEIFASTGAADLKLLFQDIQELEEGSLYWVVIYQHPQWQDPLPKVSGVLKRAGTIVETMEEPGAVALLARRGG